MKHLIFYMIFDKIDNNLEICQFCQGFGVNMLTKLTKKRKAVNLVKVGIQNKKIIFFFLHVH